MHAPSAKIAAKATMRPRTRIKFTADPRPRTGTGLVAAAVAMALLGLAAAPDAAVAHGPVAPAASSYLAKIGQVPVGPSAKIVDGDQRMWLRVPAGQTVVVLDYRGAPYLRFSPGGVQVNRSSSMYYLNQTPVALAPPRNLSASTPPSWQQVSGGHEYSWHDGRLHALATVAVTPGTRFVGTWRIPLAVDGRQTAISGGLWYAPDPSIVWFWPIVVLLLCVLAAWRLHDRELDARVARILGTAALIATATAASGQELRGHPAVTALQLVELALIYAFIAWGLWRVAFRPQGYFHYLLIALAALLQGLLLIPTLLDGFVLIALPAFVARAATVVCIGAGLALFLLVFRLPALHETAAAEDEWEHEREEAWELARDRIDRSADPVDPA
jgi:hypothetical protein